MAKKQKFDPEVVAAETPLAASGNSSTADEADELLTSDDHGDPDGRIFEVAGTADASEPEPDETLLAPAPKSATEWKPGSCLNCGETTTDAVQVIAPERYRCTRCGHTWTLADEQAPFRRMARR
jgi:hypothetical protein